SRKVDDPENDQRDQPEDGLERAPHRHAGDENRHLRAGHDHHKADAKRDEDRRQIDPAQKIGEGHKRHTRGVNQGGQRYRGEHLARDDAARFDRRDEEQVDIGVRTLGGQPRPGVERHEDYADYLQDAEEHQERLLPGVESGQRGATRHNVYSDCDELNQKQHQQGSDYKTALHGLPQLLHDYRIDAIAETDLLFQN